MTYSVEELLYEYLSKTAFVESKRAQAEAESDKMKEEQWEEAESWADQMEAEEKAAQETVNKLKETVEKAQIDPRLDPANIEWMEEQIKKDKEYHGEDFGEDLSVDFNED